MSAMEKRVASSQLLMRDELEMVKQGMSSMESKLDGLSNMVNMLAQSVNRITPSPPPYINHDKSSSILENRLLPKENKHELIQRFHTLKQGKRTVAMYIEEFDDLRLKRVIWESTELAIAWFIGGLYGKIAYEVGLKKHETLEGVYKYALKVERKRALAKMTNSKSCTTMERSAKQGVSVTEMESPKPSVPPPPPPPPPMSFNMPPPPFPPMHQDEPPLPKHDLPPPSSPPPPKPQPHVEEKGGLFIELSKNDEVSDKKGRHKENDDRVASVEKENNGIMLEIFVVKGKLSSWGFLVWFSGEKLGVIIFKVGNFFRLRWENLKQVKMKGNRSFTN